MDCRETRKRLRSLLFAYFKGDSLTLLERFVVESLLEWLDAPKAAHVVHKYEQGFSDIKLADINYSSITSVKALDTAVIQKLFEISVQYGLYDARENRLH